MRPKLIKNPGKNRYDFSLLFVVIFLCIFGLIMVYSSSYYTAEVKLNNPTYYFRRQLIFALAGFASIAVVSVLPHRLIGLLGVIPCYLVSVVLMVLTDFTKLGKTVNGQTRWLRITENFSIQPAELVKLAVILATAWFLTKCKDEIDEWKTLLWVFVITFIPGSLVLIKNLSSGIIIFAIPMVMLFMVSQNKKRAALVIGGGIALIVVAYLSSTLLIKAGILHEYQMRRIMVWRDPEAYAQEGGYQVLQGLYAIGSGGLFGKGLGNSTQKLGFLPEASNDMIFSVLCEELGVFGAVCLILLYLFLLYRIMNVAANAPDLFSSLVCIGIFAHIALQVILHISVVTGVIPNTGVTLPLVSYGGTSLALTLFEMGIVLCISKSNKKDAAV